MPFVNIFQVAIEIWTGIFSLLYLFISFKKAMKEGGNVKRCMTLLFLSCVMIFADACTYIFRDQEYQVAHMILKISIFLVFFLQELINLCLTMVVNRLIHQSQNLVWDWNLRISAVALGVSMFGVITNPFTHLFYEFTENGAYVRNAAIIIPFVIPMISFALTTINVILHKKDLPDRLWKLLLVTFSIILGSIFVQYVILGVGIVNVAVCAALLFLYISLWFDKQERKMEQKLQGLGVM